MLELVSLTLRPTHPSGETAEGCSIIIFFMGVVTAASNWFTSEVIVK